MQPLMLGVQRSGQQQEHQRQRAARHSKVDSVHRALPKLEKSPNHTQKGAQDSRA